MYRFIEASIIGFSLSKPAFFPYLPAETAQRLIFSFGPFKLVYGGLLWFTAYILRIFLVAALTFSFIYTTQPTKILNVLYRFGIPSYVGNSLLISLRLIPDFIRLASQIKISLLLRGITFSLLQDPRRNFRFALLSTSIFSRFLLDYVENVSVTIKLRKFRVVRSESLQFGRLDFIFLLVSIIPLLIFIG